ncbi:OLC1v1020441C2 [Oldenlandia corymbosa var. corymbosa]|uniref:OLC1v1020441C2 n=1 Tax=Oldenlandia corymbosa var. corymbosa TaxID=529605 RepID=A0AAV1EGJ4_OLDCO|nr:OLC1v1020441C2 [Oldenlandia corymbosa var. corymbosa]
MGALTSNRKRVDESVSVNLKSPVTYSPSSEFHVAKKPRISSCFKHVADRSKVLNYFRYPTAKSELKREPHAPVRQHRVRNSLNSKQDAPEVSFLGSSATNMGNFFTSFNDKKEAYENKKRTAFESLRHVKIVEDTKADEAAVSEDSSIEVEVEILGDEKDQKWKESSGVVLEESPAKVDDMIVEQDSRPSTSSVLTNGNLKGEESPEKLLESLHLDGDYNAKDPRVYKKLWHFAERSNSKLSALQFEIELKQKEWEIQQLLRPQKKEEAVKEDVASEAFKPLTEEEEAEVASALSNSNRRKQLATHESSNITITGEILQCLRPGAWLNDEVINLYFELLKEREKREPQKFLKCHFFNTFFYKKLTSGRGGYNYQSVRRWTSQRKLGYCIYDCDKIFVPIHKEVHWCLAVINKKETKIQYLDSLGGGDSHVMAALSRYIVDEVKEKNGKDLDVSSWGREFVEDLPEQRNGFDCGVFMIKYADFYSRDIGLCFSQDDMPYFRMRTAKEILRLKAE